MTGAGFVCVKDEDSLRKFLQQVPSQVPFLEVTDEVDFQPDIDMAPNQRTVRPSEKPDKMEERLPTTRDGNASHAAVGQDDSV